MEQERHSQLTRTPLSLSCPGKELLCYPYSVVPVALWEGVRSAGSAGCTGAQFARCASPIDSRSPWCCFPAGCGCAAQNGCGCALLVHNPASVVRLSVRLPLTAGGAWFVLLNMAGTAEDEATTSDVHVEVSGAPEVPAAASPAAKKFSLKVHEIAKDAQNQNGLRHGDYHQYRQYCTRRLKRVRSLRQVRFMFGKGKTFVQKVCMVEYGRRERGRESLFCFLYSSRGLFQGSPLQRLWKEDYSSSRLLLYR